MQPIIRCEYGTLSLSKVLRDIAILIRGLPDNGVIEVTSENEMFPEALAIWCHEHRYRLLSTSHARVCGIVIPHCWDEFTCQIGA